MQFLTDNPIANLHGPAFLGFFFIFIVAMCVWTWYRASSADGTRETPAPPLPEKLDPLEIAYLRGGSEEQVRLIILDLVARGYLVHAEKSSKTGRTESTIEHSPTHPDVAHLDSLARCVYDWIDQPKLAVQFFPGLSDALQKKKVARETAGQLEVLGLIASEEQRTAVRRACVPAQWLIFLLGAYKLVVALSRGRHNVIFLVLMTIAGIYLVQRFCRPHRLTALGRRYLARVQQALVGLKPRLPSLVTSRDDAHFNLAVAAFGIGALDITSYAFYPKMFDKGARHPAGGCASAASCGVAAPAVSSGGGGSGCGSGSSSSCSSGSSCGSSCGGGGGCGGCGS
jgi:uncharacterized protein (TIGR04222 family)